MYTKGKWTTTSTVKTPNGLDELISVGGSPVAWAYKKDDALLIASAPALLEALEDVFNQDCGRYELKSCGHEFHCVCPSDKAKAAIASAKGKE